MRAIIGIILMALGFIFGVMYDQNMVVLKLQREAIEANERVQTYWDALNTCTKNKFKSKDYLLDQVRKINREG